MYVLYYTWILVGYFCADSSCMLQLLMLIFYLQRCHVDTNWMSISSHSYTFLMIHIVPCISVTSCLKDIIVFFYFTAFCVYFDNMAFPPVPQGWINYLQRCNKDDHEIYFRISWNIKFYQISRNFVSFTVNNIQRNLVHNTNYIIVTNFRGWNGAKF